MRRAGGDGSATADLHLLRGVPAEMQGWPALPFRLVPRSGGRLGKVPLRADGRPCDHRDPVNHVSYARALNLVASGVGDGLGVVLPVGVVMIDVDGCVTGRHVDPAVEGTLRAVDSYAEISVSGHGVKAFALAVKPGARCRAGRYELYGPGWYAALTGRRLGVPCLKPAQGAVDTLYARLFGVHAGGVGRPATVQGPPVIGDVLARALRARNGWRFRRLYVDGDITGYASASEADFALLRMLHFWFGADPAVLDQVMRSSALMRAKWGGDYAARSIARAIALGGLTWQGGFSEHRKRLELF